MGSFPELGGKQWAAQEQKVSGLQPQFLPIVARQRQKQFDNSQWVKKAAGNREGLGWDRRACGGLGEERGSLWMKKWERGSLESSFTGPSGHTFLTGQVTGLSHIPDT